MDGGFVIAIGYGTDIMAWTAPRGTSKQVAWSQMRGLVHVYSSLHYAEQGLKRTQPTRLEMANARIMDTAAFESELLGVTNGNPDPTLTLADTMPADPEPAPVPEPSAVEQSLAKFLSEAPSPNGPPYYADELQQFRSKVANETAAQVVANAIGADGLPTYNPNAWMDTYIRDTDEDHPFGPDPEPAPIEVAAAQVREWMRQHQEARKSVREAEMIGDDRKAFYWDRKSQGHMTMIMAGQQVMALMGRPVEWPMDAEF
jgi:hypothetical protein